MAGAGLAVAGAGTLAPEPVGQTPLPWEVDVKEDYGATGDGGVDDAPAFQAAFSALGSEPGLTGHPQGITGARILVPPGDYVFRSTVRIHRFAGIIHGSGLGMGPKEQGKLRTGLGTVIRWDGPPGDPMFEITDSRFLQMRDLRFFGRDEGPPRAGIRFLKRRGDDQGSNGELVVSDCYFGTWPWTGVDRGLILNGIEFVGDAGDNDQFRIVRCNFADRIGSDTVGVRIDATQSIWGSLTDCVFDGLAVGLDTHSSVTAVNPQFNACGTDLQLGSTARVEIVGWQSEHSGCLARLDQPAGLHVTGGTCQIDGSTMRPGEPLIDAYPSANRQSVSLESMLFTYPPSVAYPDGLRRDDGPPDIHFGPRPATAQSSGFSLSIDDCVGLGPEQCTLVEPLTGDSKGTVQWHSRSGGIHQFRNELRGDGTPGSRTTLDTGVWDPPIAGSS